VSNAATPPAAADAADADARVAAAARRLPPPPLPSAPPAAGEGIARQSAVAGGAAAVIASGAGAAAGGASPLSSPSSSESMTLDVYAAIDSTASDSACAGVLVLAAPAPPAGTLDPAAHAPYSLPSGAAPRASDFPSAEALEAIHVDLSAFGGGAAAAHPHPPHAPPHAPPHVEPCGNSLP
jgi:hypothetical protein